jgi:hypothetical protein
MTSGRRMFIRFSAGVLAGLLALAPAMPASAQNLLQSFFSDLDHALRGRERLPERLPERIPAFAEPFSNINRVTPPAMPVEAGPAKAFCVRTCDGHFFPVRAQPGMSVAEACHAFCPASETRIYSGGAIDYAVARDGSRYADLPNAYVYRRRIVAGCTCNGHDVFGLAHIDVGSDPTLKPGDVVATEHGLVAFTGRKDRIANFTPVESYPYFSASFRDQLSSLRVMSPTLGVVNATPVNLPLSSERTNDQNRRTAER